MLQFDVPLTSAEDIWIYCGLNELAFPVPKLNACGTFKLVKL